MRRRFGRLALAVGALAVIAAWIARQRKATDAIRESYETARERFEEARKHFEEAREQLRERVLRERGQETGEEPAHGTEEAEERVEREGTEGHRAYFRKVIEESNKRASGHA